jgi:hypothetical protein
MKSPRRESYDRLAGVILAAVMSGKELVRLGLGRAVLGERPLFVR